MARKLTIAAFVICIVALAAGIRWFIRVRSQSSYASCITLLRQIDGAQQWWAVEHNKTTNDIPTWDDLVGPDRYMREKPTCPQGGTYTLSRVGDYPRCSILMHSFYFGMVAVVDESGAPVPGAHVSVEGVSMQGQPTLTDTNGHATVTRWSGIVVDDWSRGTSSIMAFLNGYQTGRVALPSGWPVVIKMKREKK